MGNWIAVVETCSGLNFDSWCVKISCYLCWCNESHTVCNFLFTIRFWVHWTEAIFQDNEKPSPFIKSKDCDLNEVDWWTAKEVEVAKDIQCKKFELSSLLKDFDFDEADNYVSGVKLQRYIVKAISRHLLDSSYTERHLAQLCRDSAEESQ